MLVVILVTTVLGTCSYLTAYTFVHVYLSTTGVLCWVFKVPLGCQAYQAAAISPKETQAQLAFLGYQVSRDVGDPKDLLDLRATLAVQDQKVH